MPDSWPWPDELDAVIAVPEALWSEPLPPHTLENVGATRIHVVSVELIE